MAISDDQPLGTEERREKQTRVPRRTDLLTGGFNFGGPGDEVSEENGFRASWLLSWQLPEMENMRPKWMTNSTAISIQIGFPDISFSEKAANSPSPPSWIFNECFY
ncbi:predicted protein [Histoplasma capsulatum H143]|uniref:Uncharacterized protein n=1 Tax=Ajellomyces capsulatus (strain H143) TaxID=544712 RepID=C6H5L1_AJECH|nr:predicted protein [Histoplasma capsulatum H143]